MSFTDVTPFEPLILKSHFKWDSNIIKVCEELIESAKHPAHLEKNDGKSSVSNNVQPHILKEFQPFYDFIMPKVNDILYNVWDVPLNWKNVVGNSWVNVHGKGSFTDEHQHGTATMVITAYINLPKDSGYIQFKDPLEYSKGIRPKNPSIDTFYKTVEAQTGDILMFPGFIRHKTEESKTYEKRWVLTTNIISYKIQPTNRTTITRDDIR